MPAHTKSEMPEYDSHAHRHVQGMFCAILRYFQNHVGCIHHILTHSGNFIAEDYRIFLAFCRHELIQHHGIHSLLRAYDEIALFPESCHSLHRVGDMFPFDTVLSTQGRLMYFSRRRHGTNAAQPDLVYLEGICRTEGRTYIMSASYVVQYNYYPGLGKCLILLCRDTSQLYIEQFSVPHVKKLSTQR